MENNNISSKEIIKKLHSNNIDLQLSAIEDIRNQGNEQLLTELVKILNSSTSLQIHSNIYSCISDIKDKNIIPFLISIVKNPDFASKKREILNTLWQTNLDFSDYSVVFIDILIEDSFEIGIEALTLIDICAEFLTQKTKQDFRSKITLAFPKVDEMKKKLLEQALLILE